MQSDLSKNHEELVQEVKNLQVTLNHIGAYVFMKDLEGKYTYVNELVRILFDQPIEEIIGYDDSKFFSLELSSDVKKNDQKVMTEGKVIELEEKNIIAKTGEVKYYMTVKKPLFDDNKNIIGMFGVSTDITERKQMEFELKRKQELLDTVLNNIDAFIYMKDRDYRYLYLNPKTANLFGAQPSEIVGKTEEDFLAKKDVDHFRKMDLQVFETGNLQNGEEHFTASDGTVSHYWSIKVPLKDNEGKVNSYIGISTDITQLSTTDALTNINNRRTLDIELNKIFSLYKRYQHPYCIILCDIDYFKQTNDIYGHFEGDKVLQIVSKTIQNEIRATDICGRWGGEEFLIICPDTQLENAVSLAEKLRKKIEKVHDEFDCHLTTMSFGVSQSQKKDKNLYDIVKRADKAMYKAKESGRNQVVY